MDFKPKNARDRFILSLDVSTVNEAEKIVEETKNVVGAFKFGMELQFAIGGIDYAKRLVDQGLDIFLDGKLLDIDNTIISAMKNLQTLGVKFVTIHAYPNTMRAVVKNLNNSKMCLLGVTVLTSMDDNDVKAAGYRETVKSLVESRCKDAQAAGMNGIVCSPNEVKRLREITDSKMVFVTPGIRPKGSDPNDQKRIATPFQAIINGSDYLVIGRPVTRSKDMKGVSEKILEEIEIAHEQLNSNKSSNHDKLVKNNTTSKSNVKIGQNLNYEAEAA